MKLQVLHVPGCPNTTVLVGRLEEVIAGRRDLLLEHQVINDEAQATTWGMTGSPTLLIDGVDPFQVAGAAPSISCRLYRDEGGVPSIAALRAALDSGSEPVNAGR